MDEVFSLIGEVIQSKKTITTPHVASQVYWRKIPQLISTQAKIMENHPMSLNNNIIPSEKDLANNIKVSWLRPETFSPIFKELSQWKLTEKNILESFLLEVLPRFLLVSSLKKSENKTYAVSESLLHLTQMVKKKKVIITSMFCPSYNYILLPNGLIRIINHAFRKNVGIGFSKTLLLLKEVFSPLALHGIYIQLLLLTYSGEKNPEDLLEIVRSTRNYYKGKEKEMLSNIQEGYKDAERVSSQILKGSGIFFKMISIEKTYAKAVHEIAKKFLNRFSISKENSSEFLSDTLGVKLGWLDTFIDSEMQETIILGDSIKKEDQKEIVLNGLYRGLLYYKILKSVEDSKGLLIDLESQTYTMQDSLSQYEKFIPAVITGKSFDEHFGIRGPFEYEIAYKKE